ncbi:MAG: Response regulator containing a CheY-like receiver domain and a domain protein [Bacteroidota bacterium]|jgi:ligand-binding sensor domain-containing protein/serine phosphatase RsbU (regulator of sigma subunit)|nr:Response regulator containing a CheY-like receiver domain and a domain protein [Bacteroidota bacterium]
MNRRIRKYLSLLIFLLLSVINTLGQQYNFKNYTAKNGLANSIVNNIFQDSRGYMWFGTQGGGVSRFNGKTFRNFTSTDGLIANDVTFISEDRNGNIWIATSEGVSMYDGQVFKNFSKKEGLSEGVVFWIYADKQNNIWFAIQDGGINKYDGKSFTAFTKKDGLPSNNVFCIVEDAKNDLWLGASNGIAKYDGSRVTSYEKIDVINKKTFFSAYVDSKGVIWFGGTSGNGLLRYKNKRFEDIMLPETVKNDFIGSITEDNKGNLWFATEHGVLKYENKQFHLFTEKQGLSTNGVLSVNKDYEGNIWIGTQNGGVNMFNNESLVNYTDKDGLPSNNISTICSTADGNYVVGTPGAGIFVLEKRTNTFREISGIPEIGEINVFSVTEARNGQLWIGAQEGVFVLGKDNGKFHLITSYKKKDKVELVAALKIIEDNNGTKWVASYGSGVFRIKDDNLIVYNKKNGFISDNILTIFQDSKSNLWIGTKDEGVVKFDGKSFVNYNNKEGLADKSVWSISEDDKGNLYFGTGEKGICIFDGKKFKNYSVKDGLCSDYIPVLQWDNIDKCLWVGTDKGANRLTFLSDMSLANVRYYGEQEGFKGLDINQNAILMDKSGLIWFGSNTGLIRYDRKYDFPNITPPKLHLTGIRLAYQNVDWKMYADSVDKNRLPINLRLSHKNNNLTFDFQAFTTNNVKYTFILEGQDDEWSPLTDKPEAVFTNIDPGKNYTFRVRAVNSNGVWNKETISFSFSIAPPWWKTWWFYTLVIALAVLSIYSFINYRTAQLAKEKKVLEEKVTERTVELKQANDQLSVAFQDIKDSINYAKKIQDAILPLDEEIRKALPQSFVLFKPRDVVSGDFYWFNKKDDKIYIAAVDCTGHGVPGAFMSMIGSSLLNEIISKKGSHDAASVLKKLHQGVRKSLKQDRDSYESKDGMDLALAVIDTITNTLQYSGAKRPLLHYNNGMAQEIKADKQSIGGLEMEDNYIFNNHNFPIQKGDTFYLFTDGYVDQFGGEREKKYSTKRFKETLASIQQLTMTEQKVKLDNEIETWKSGIEQIDDILVIGLRF